MTTPDLTDVDTDDLFAELSRRHSAALLMYLVEYAEDDQMMETMKVHFSGGRMLVRGMAHAYLHGDPDNDYE